MKQRWPSDSALRWVNRALLLIIIGCNGYVIVAPLWPRVTYAVQTSITKPVKVTAEKQDTLDDIDRSYNHIIIPKLQLDERIYDGPDPNLVHRGIWRRPNTAKPGSNSNVVMVGHRFTYNGPSVFYHLDKLKPEHEIIVVWDGTVYIYRVFNTGIVGATALDVEAPSSEERLTLYTCDPLWSVRNRLVVSAYVEKVVE